MRRSAKEPVLGSIRILRKSSSEVQPDLGSIRIMRRSFDEHQPVSPDLGSIRIMRRSDKPMAVELKDKFAQVVSNGDGAQSNKVEDNYLVNTDRVMLRENRATPSLDSLRIM